MPHPGSTPLLPAIRALLVAALLLLGLLGCSSEPARAARPLFKGVELYSWVDAPTQAWSFVLLPGTNRRKPAAEVQGSHEVLRSRAELERRLALLAESEEVFWQVSQADGFALPPAADLEAIVSYAAAKGIRIHVPAR